ncbi:hypothetical protein [Microbispora bryophytorum]|uniref:hypothetical protein n=1 Tax=Microbispora bryophytorum TaxID=1460882 RepID=UPI00340E29FB
MPAYARVLLPVLAGTRRHRAFTVALVAAAALRVITMLGYPPARMYWYDSFAYLHNAVHLQPDQGFHPIGYPLLLRALLPFHSVGVVVAVQHAMGLATGAVVYAALRGRGLPGWAAVAASAPVLFDASFLRLEHAVVSDTLFILLVVAATALLVRRPVPSARAAATAGLLLGGAALTRTIALPLILLVLLVLAVRRVPWRRPAVLALAGPLPVVAYAAWYGGVHGRIGVSGSDGVALWARSMTFADCAVIQPPQDLAPLCPNGTVLDAATDQPLAEQVRRAYDPDLTGMRSVRPYADLLIAYQYPAYLRGPLLAAILLLGLIGALRRPGRAAALPWAVAVTLLVAPVAVLDFDHRYVLPVVPVACLAAGLTFARPPRRAAVRKVREVSREVPSAERIG